MGPCRWNLIDTAMITNAQTWMLKRFDLTHLLMYTCRMFGASAVRKLYELRQ